MRDSALLYTMYTFHTSTLRTRIHYACQQYNIIDYRLNRYGDNRILRASRDSTRVVSRAAGLEEIVVAGAQYLPKYE